MKLMEQITQWMTRKRGTTIGLVAGATALGTMQTTPEVQAQSEQPNIIVILADDLGWRDINCWDGAGGQYTSNAGGEYDDRQISTPNLAELRQNSMRFTNVCAYPFCTATRAALFTGRYTERFPNLKTPPQDVCHLDDDTSGSNLVAGFSRNELPHEATTIAEVLSDAYTKALIGKWHLSDTASWPSFHAFLPGVPENGFNYAIGMEPLGWNTYLGRYWEYDPANLVDFHAWNQGMSGAFDLNSLWGHDDNDDYWHHDDYGQYITGAIEKKAERFIDKHGNSPFFLMLSHIAPHRPLCEPAGTSFTDNSSNYIKVIQALDDTVGWLMTKVNTIYSQNGRKTVIIFLGDNGSIDDYAKLAPLRGQKGSTYEGGVRVPMLVYWPTVTDDPNNSGAFVCDTRVHVVDIAPTILEIAGQNPNKHTFDGKSLVPLIQGQQENFARPNDATFMHYPRFSPRPSAFVTQGNFKLIKFYDWQDEQSNGYDWEEHFDHGTLQLKRDVPAIYELYASGVTLDGVDDGIAVSGYSGIQGDASRTVTAWISCNDENIGAIISWGYRTDDGLWSIYVDDNGELSLWTWSSVVSTSGQDLRDGLWHHVAVVHAQGLAQDNITFYVDGEPAGTGTLAVQTDSGYTFTIGQNPYGYDSFAGVLDDVRVYSSALSCNEIDALANLWENGDLDPNLVGHWRLDGDANDSGPNGYHGAAYGNPTWDILNEGPKGNCISPDFSEEMNGADPNATNGYEQKALALHGLLTAWQGEIKAQMPGYQVARFRVISGEEVFQASYAGSSQVGEVSALTKALMDNATCAGDIIKLCPGKHTVGDGLAGVKIGEAITIQSIDPEDPDVVASTIITTLNGADETSFTSGPVIQIDPNGTGCLINGLTIMDGSGGGIDGGGHNVTIKNCRILRNSKDGNGAGICNVTSGEISNCIIESNTAFDSDPEGGEPSGNGGGIANCSAPISNCVIACNTATGEGGGLYGCSGPITNCTITGNAVQDNPTGTGGGLTDCGGDITNCIIWCNRPDQLVDCNSPAYSCAGNPAFVNCFTDIVWTSADSNPTSQPSPTDFLFDDLIVNDTTNIPIGSLIEYNNDGVLRRVCNIIDIAGATMKVEFDPPISPETEKGKPVYIWPLGTTSVIEDFHLSTGSPCIDPTSIGSIVSASDIDGDERMLDGNGDGTATVDIGADEYARARITGKHGYDTIQKAIDAAEPGDEIVVYPGTYSESINFDSKDIVVRSTEPDDWDVVASTIIDGSPADANHVVVFDGAETSACRLEGLTITGGAADDDTEELELGAGQRGGGIMGWGGHVSASHATVNRCILRGNTCELTGSAIWSLNGTISNCRIEDNHGRGALAACSGPIMNCLLTGNTTGVESGVLFNCDGQILNCTIADNFDTSCPGSAFWLCDGVIANCIVWGNELGTAGAFYSSTASVHYCFVESDPLFVDAANGDYHLKATSPCINAGTNDYYIPGDTDMDGEDRLMGPLLDIGADEWPWPVAHWKLDETSASTAADSSGGAHAGALVSFRMDDLQWISGQIGGALEFDGTNDYVTIDEDPNDFRGIGGDNVRTCTAWVNLGNTWSTAGVILGWGFNDGDDVGRKWMFRIGLNRLLDVGIYGDSIAGSTALPSAEWHHVAVVLEDVDRSGTLTTSDMRLYVNGILENSACQLGTLAIDTDTSRAGYGVTVGARMAYGVPEGVPGVFFNGGVDDVRIYDRALTVPEIAALAAMGQ